MSVINLLSPHVADLIAAGEVVERPASVIKELVENSIDAGAKNITVEIRGGGMSYIRVTDDGCGMSPEDAGVAFLRHATSKLKDERGLESISTLGFRGEALAAISSVSRIELRTRLRGEAEGTYVHLIAGDIQEMHAVGCPEGSTMIVSDLFYNTPARLKFMKSDRAESSACVAAALKCALGHPEVSVRMLRDGQEEFFSPGDGQMRSCVYSLLGRDNAMGMLECSGGDEEVGVKGYVSAPYAGRGNRAMQFFFINGRAFRSAVIQAALEQAYKNTLLTGRFPGCVLYITLSFGKVDVNVHPTKSEVKFTQEKAVFDAVYYAVLSTLTSPRGENRTAEISLSGTTCKAAKSREDSFRPATGSTPYAGEKPVSRAPTPSLSYTHAPAQTRLPLDSSVTFRSEAPKYQVTTPLSSPMPLPGTAPAPLSKAVASSAAPVPEPAAEMPDYRVVGEVLETYIVVESRGEMLLIDKHACHERIIFDRLMKNGGEPMSQTLLTPVTYTPGRDAVEILEENLDALEKAGFEIEPFGEDSVIVRAVPADSEGSEVAMLEEIISSLRTSGSIESKRDAICHTIACKAAVKAGKRSHITELQTLAEKVLSGEVRYCPHGRPVCVRLTKTELDKFFKRIVT